MAEVMSGAWGFLLALDWEFYETFFPNRTEENEMFASVVFAPRLCDSS